MRGSGQRRIRGRRTFSLLHVEGVTQEPGGRFTQSSQREEHGVRREEKPKTHPPRPGRDSANREIGVPGRNQIQEQGRTPKVTGRAIPTGESRAGGAENSLDSWGTGRVYHSRTTL